MASVQIITLHDRPAAIAVNATVLIDPDVPTAELAHVQAKALYALEIHDGTLPGPYTDAGAEAYAQRARAAAQRSSAARPRTARRHDTKPRRPRKR